jgi:hypothetical protein
MAMTVMAKKGGGDMSKVTSIARTEKLDARNILTTGSRPPEATTSSPRTSLPRAFTAAEKSLIKKLHGFMPAEQLLRILNDRLVCDLGSHAAPYTMEQLYTEIGDAAGAVPAGGHDWASLRKLLAKARRDGVLASVSDQVIDDFAIVFSLNAKQVLRLKDILLNVEDEEE